MEPVLKLNDSTVKSAGFQVHSSLNLARIAMWVWTLCCRDYTLITIDIDSSH